MWAALMHPVQHRLAYICGIIKFLALTEMSEILVHND